MAHRPCTRANIAEMTDRRGPREFVATRRSLLNAIPGNGVHIVDDQRSTSAAARKRPWERGGRSSRRSEGRTGLHRENMDGRSSRDAGVLATSRTAQKSERSDSDTLRDKHGVAGSRGIRAAGRPQLAIVDEVELDLLDEGAHALIISGEPEVGSAAYYGTSGGACVPNFLGGQLEAGRFRGRRRGRQVPTSSSDEKAQRRVSRGTEQGVKKGRSGARWRHRESTRPQNSQLVNTFTRRSRAQGRLYHPRGIEYVIENTGEGSRRRVHRAAFNGGPPGWRRKGCPTQGGGGEGRRSHPGGALTIAERITLQETTSASTKEARRAWPPGHRADRGEGSSCAYKTLERREDSERQRPGGHESTSTDLVFKDGRKASSGRFGQRDIKEPSRPGPARPGRHDSPSEKWKYLSRGSRSRGREAHRAEREGATRVEARGYHRRAGPAPARHDSRPNHGGPRRSTFKAGGGRHRSSAAL